MRPRAPGTGYCVGCVVVVVVVDGCVVVVVVWDGAGTTSVVGCGAGGFTVVWEHAENRPRATPARVGRISFFMVVGSLWVPL